MRQFIQICVEQGFELGHDFDALRDLVTDAVEVSDVLSGFHIVFRQKTGLIAARLRMDIDWKAHKLVVDAGGPKAFVLQGETDRDFRAAVSENIPLVFDSIREIGRIGDVKRLNAQIYWRDVRTPDKIAYQNELKRRYHIAPLGEEELYWLREFEAAPKQATPHTYTSSSLSEFSFTLEVRRDRV